MGVKQLYSVLVDGADKEQFVYAYSSKQAAYIVSNFRGKNKVGKVQLIKRLGQLSLFDPDLAIPKEAGLFSSVL